MADHIDFKNLWKQQTAEKPSIQELLGKLKKFRNENLRKLVLTNILLVLTCMGIGLIWHYYQPQLLTTKIGIVVVILAMVIYLAVYNHQLLMNFYKLDHTKTNTEYLHNLYSLKNRQKFIQTTMLDLYFMMLFTGISLYMYEYASRMELLYAAAAYALTFVWIAINWFYIRPKMIKKQEAKLNGLINKFEEINGQLKE